MKTVAILMLGLGMALAACAPVESPTRNAPAGPDAAPTLMAPQSPLSVRNITVHVPQTLTVSEANRYLPNTDIVWREDPLGDRHAQVEAIVLNAMERGTANLHGSTAVDLDVTITRFHALTEKARYSVGGIHSISFDLAVRDATTGELLEPVRSVSANLKGYGGNQALEAEARRITQKVRITSHLAAVIQQELAVPQG